ncbi:D-arabinono-1,4-lactone oxidase [Hondaea fermentalgiana]|uniref:D-arabinono-1,4-lactone oxidase n=1 Tax=Hondaea fermentalgiana TaxID=2315210 RepID=A0A2R5GMS4_9STRA|nr:D-arabinono-1,4-lactone oxidase [Hondaea fermentalgiana]|eukprot:GBG29611.1 D-arabinono-1,4-lactone oxidase [Hondaea fermentalgiana]
MSVVDYVATSNWAGNIKWTREGVTAVKDTEHLATIVKEATGPIRALGTGHCFSPIANTEGVHVRLLGEAFGKVTIDKDASVVTLGAGVTYAKLLDACEEADVCLANCPSLPHITVVGSIMTGTHGTGWNKKTIGNEVVGLEVVRSDGSIDKVGAKDEDLPWIVQSWGAAGVVTSVTLKVYPKHEIYKQIIMQPDWTQTLEKLEDIYSAAEYVSIFAHWGPEGASVNSIWFGLNKDQMPEHVKKIFPEGTEEVEVGQGVHPVLTLDAKNCIKVGSTSVNRCQYHFIPGGTPSSGVGLELQSEFFVPFDKARAALAALSERSGEFCDLVVVAELRLVVGDNLPLSVCRQSEAERFLGIHFTWHFRQDEVAICLRDIVQPIFKQFGPLRPHVGKVFVRDESMDCIFEKYEDLKAKFDPESRFQGFAVATSPP